MIFLCGCTENGQEGKLPLLPERVLWQGARHLMATGPLPG